MTGTRDWRGIARGLFMILFGAGFGFYSLGYRFGTLFRMGPGFFPRVLAVAMIAVGLLLLVRALRAPGGAPIHIEWRPLATIAASLLLFALLVGPIGLWPTTVIVTVVASLGQSNFHPVRALILGVCLGLFVTTLFIWGLGLPMNVYWSR